MTVRGVGYRGIVNLKGEVIVPAQLDPREAAALQAAFAWASRDEIVLDGGVSREAGQPVLATTVSRESGSFAARENLPLVAVVHLPAERPAKLPTRVIGLAPEATIAEHEAAIGREIAKLAPGGRWKPRAEDYKKAKKNNRRNRFERFSRARKGKAGKGGASSSGAAR